MSGTGDDLKGRTKEAVADLTHDRDLKHEGQRDQAAGKAKHLLSDAKGWIEHRIDAVRDRANK